MNVSCILGLTGTATLSTIQSLSQMLQIEHDNVISEPILRPNLKLTVSKIIEGDNRYLFYKEIFNDIF